MDLFDLKFKNVKFLPGLNIWSYMPVMQTIIDIGHFETNPTHLIEGFTDGLINLLPSLYSHKCSKGYEGGFIERLRDGTWMGHVLEHVSLELQIRCGLNTKFGQTR